MTDQDQNKVYANFNHDVEYGKDIIELGITRGNPQKYSYTLAKLKLDKSYINPEEYSFEYLDKVEDAMITLADAINKGVVRNGY